MNDQSNPVGTDQAEVAAKASGRRRLVRGAVSLAPVVLTLRSGGLAAASCTGVKVFNVNTNGDGKFDPPTGSGVVAGDYCASPVQECGPEHPTKISGGTIDSMPITGPDINSKFTCGTSGNRTVAILSSASAGSLGIPIPLPQSRQRH